MGEVVTVGGDGLSVRGVSAFDGGERGDGAFEGVGGLGEGEVGGFAAWYPGRALVPFAVRTDRDDVACWDLDRGPRAISVIDDFDTPGDEQLESFDEFNDWLRQAIEDLIDYEYDSGILPWP